MGKVSSRTATYSKMGAKIYNSTLTKELREGAKIMQSIDATPSELAEKVIPVMEVNPKLLRRSNIVRSLNATNATTATIYTTPTDRDFYLVSASISVIKDVTSTSLVSLIGITIDGVVRSLITISGISLTPQSETNNATFPFPIKIDKGTNITIQNSTNVANIRSEGTIVGYLDETSNV